MNKAKRLIETLLRPARESMEYLSDTFMHYMAVAVRAAHKPDMKIVPYDEAMCIVICRKKQSLLTERDKCFIM